MILLRVTMEIIVVAAISVGVRQVTALLIAITIKIISSSYSRIMVVEALALALAEKVKSPLRSKKKTTRS